MPIEPQFLYMILILPGIFGLTLIGEGIHKIFNEEWNGLISILFGLIALGIVLATYILFSNFLKPIHHT